MNIEIKNKDKRTELSWAEVEKSYDKIFKCIDIYPSLRFCPIRSGQVLVFNPIADRIKMSCVSKGHGWGNKKFVETKGETITLSF